MVSKKPLFFFIISILFLYWFFFPQILNPKFTFWASDAQIKFFPSVVYLSENLSQGKFPFWTERAFLGYPIYEDIELGYLNPINIVITYLFSPIYVFKIIHFFTYLIGSFSFYFLFEKLKFNFWSKIGAVLIFYFSFFHLNHLAHPNMVFTTMLLPLHLLLGSFFISKNSFKYIIFQSLVVAYSILWGQLQIVFLNFIVIFLFFYFETKKIRSTLIYSFLIFIFSLAFSMHQLLPTFNSYISSYRFGSELKYSDFHNFPLLLSANIFPYIFGYFGNYQGVNVSAAFSFIETYNYLGIVAFISFVFYLIYGFKDRNFKFVLSVVTLYVLISFFKIPYLDNFRYWTRGVYLISLVFVFSFAYISNNNFDLKEYKKRYILLTVSFLTVLNIILEDSYYQKFNDYLLNFNFRIFKKETLLVWVFLLFISISLYFVRSYVKKFSLYLQILLVLLLLIDYKYFSIDFIYFRVSRFTQFSKMITPFGCENNRCLLQNTNLSGYESLYYKNYSPFGYSQFLSDEYLRYFNKNFFDDPRKSIEREDLDVNINLSELEKLGFKKIVLNSSDVVVSHKPIDIFNGEIKGNYIYKNEGDILIDVNAPRSDNYWLSLKYSPNWNAFLDDKKVTLTRDGLFSQIYLPKGQSTLKIYYFPYDILYGLIIGVVLFVLGYFIYTLSKKRALRVIISSENI